MWLRIHTVDICTTMLVLVHFDIKYLGHSSSYEKNSQWVTEYENLDIGLMLIMIMMEIFLHCNIFTCVFTLHPHRFCFMMSYYTVRKRSNTFAYYQKWPNWRNYITKASAIWGWYKHNFTMIHNRGKSV